MSFFSRFWQRKPAVPAVRPLRPADAAAVAAMHSEGFARGWPATEVAALLADQAVAGDGVAAGGAALVGFVMSRVAADEAEILSIAVKAAQRRGGLASALLGAHLGTLAARGVRKLFLEVEAENAAAIALYRRFGFAEVGRREAYYRRPDGRAATAVVMRRDLG
jgi:ribosomal-protein-alanine N-acetyltransferase